MIYLKVHADLLNPGNQIISLCDADLIGKRFEDGKRQLYVTEQFYKGEVKTEEEIIRILKYAQNINIVGKESISLALKAKIIDKNHVMKIKGIPHAQATSF